MPYSPLSARHHWALDFALCAVATAFCAFVCALALLRAWAFDGTVALALLFVAAAAAGYGAAAHRTYGDRGGTSPRGMLTRVALIAGLALVVGTIEYVRWRLWFLTHNPMWNVPWHAITCLYATGIAALQPIWFTPLYARQRLAGRPVRWVWAAVPLATSIVFVAVSILVGPVLRLAGVIA